MAGDDYNSIEQTELTFREQADGRRVAHLPTGKVVLIELASVGKVQNGERWIVQLDHRETFAIARPIQRVAAAPVPPTTVPAAPAPVETLPLRLRPPVPTKSTPLPPAAVPAPVPPRPADTVRPAAPVVKPVVPAAVVKASDRVALFVDGANMDGAGRDAGYFLDFARAQKYFLGPGAYYAGFYYVADYTAKDPLQIRFFNFLAHSGFIVRKKAVKVIRDQDTGETRYKANVDTELVVDMLNSANNYDVAFLFSGDSDYERLVDVLRSRGKRIYVVSSHGTLSQELLLVADKPVFHLEDHREALARIAPAAGMDGSPPQGL